MGIRKLCLRLAYRSGRLPRLITFPLFRRLLRAENCAEAWRLLGAKIDPTAHVSAKVTMRLPEKVTIGPGSRLADVEIESWDQVVIGANALISEASLLTASHELGSLDFVGFARPIRIGDYVWIARRVLVLRGVTIGDAAVVGAGAVVTRDVDPHSVVAGNPAREVGRRPEVAFSYVPGRSGFGD